MGLNTESAPGAGSVATPRVVIIGAGLAGLTCAYRLHRRRPDAEIIVVEATDRVGGKIRTTTVDGHTIDEAADAFLARVPAAVELCRELGLEGQLTSPAERRAFVYRHGSLHRFPEGLVLGVPTDLDALAASGLVSDTGLERAADDLTRPREIPGAPAVGDDETVGALVRRRIGDEVFEAFVGPLLSGVNAGDADRLSVAAGAPQFAAAVRDQPSLIEGLRTQRATALAANPDPDAPVFFALRGGTQTLTDALRAALPDGTVRLGASVVRIDRNDSEDPNADDRNGTGGQDDPWLGVYLNDGSVLLADAVVLATPTHAAAPLVADLAPDLSGELATLEWSSVIMVTAVVARDDIHHALDGSGFLVSQGEGLLMTACSFGSSKWAHWGNDREVVLRVSAGRHHDTRAWELTDAELTDRILAELGNVIGLHGRPRAVRVSRWPLALPQYRPGHLERARSWKEAATVAHPGLFLTGASYFGLGIPACISDATDTAGQVAAVLDGHQSSHATKTARIRGVVVVLHGHDDDPATFAAWAQQLAPPGFAAHAPIGPRPTEHGASWYLTDEDHEPDPASMHEAIEDLDATISALAEQHGVTRSAIVLVGFSQGAALAWEWALRVADVGTDPGRERVGALIAVSGWLPDVAGIDLDPEAVRAERVLVAHGEDDEVVPAPMGRGPGRLVARHGVPVTMVDRPTGHSFAPFTDDLRAWISADL